MVYNVAVSFRLRRINPPNVWRMNLKGLIMDFEHSSNPSGSEGVQPQQAGPVPGLSAGGPATTRKGSGWRIFWGIVTALSVMANIALVLMLIGVVAVFAVGRSGSMLAEEVIREGPARAKIAVITVEGIIYGESAKDVYSQLEKARHDKRVKGVIIRVDSPGGLISASDQIYKEILKYRQEEGKPVVAFMQDVAASGGYYTSVACEKIIAEPTALTGSIGVIMGHFVFQELLENKLGILPVILKSGKKKDWPSSFQVPTEEQLQYLQDKLITPAYERFVQVVAEGRQSQLTVDDVKRLADGGILGAQEALNEKLIDEIGYLDDAIGLVKSLAGIKEARVVEYRKPFSLASFLSYRSQGVLKINRATLYELNTPQVMYLWSAY
ncbi:MAG: signal peptide peptidase SppA [Planctomycetota bacterium]|nr:signal peptide peptidase SppA [Planctomycetota bacterium]